MNDDISKFLKSIAKYRAILSQEEINQLIYEYKQNGNLKARDKIINHNQGLVITIAKRFRHNRIELGDLISLGNQGLLQAIEKFDPARRKKFSDCAGPWIEGVIIQAIEDNGTIKTPDHVSKHYREIRKAIEKLKEEFKLNDTPSNLGSIREPTTSEIAEKTNLDEDYIIMVTHSKGWTQSLDENDIDLEGEETKQDKIGPILFHDQAARDFYGEDDAIEQYNNEILLSIELSELPEEDKQILIDHWIEEKPIKEIAKRLGITSSAVSQRIKGIKKKIQKSQESP